MARPSPINFRATATNIRSPSEATKLTSRMSTTIPPGAPAAASANRASTASTPATSSRPSKATRVAPPASSLVVIFMSSAFFCLLVMHALGLR